MSISLLDIRQTGRTAQICRIATEWHPECRFPNKNLEKEGKVVPLAGLEPALPEELDFESSASTNFTTGARMRLRLA